MSTSEQQAVILGRMVEHEQAIADLYGLFKTGFPKDAAFWSALETQEHMHAAALRKLQAAVKVGQKTVLPDRANLQAVENSLQFVKRHAALYGNGKTTRRTAVGWAVTIEQLTLEDGLFFLGADAGPQTTATFTYLHRETQLHRRQLARARRRLLNPFLFFLPLPVA